MELMSTYDLLLLSTIPIENVGVGIIVEAQYCLYTTLLVDFFALSFYPEIERQQSIK